MKVPTKYIAELGEEEKKELKRLMKEDPSSRVRMRANSILLSNRKYSIDEIVDIYEVDRDTVSIWIQNWEELGYEGLLDLPKSGRPPILNEKEQEKVKLLVQKDPQSIRRVVGQIKKKPEKK